MGLTPASDGRWAFTTREPIGVVAAISAFNHPLNLIVHQVAPAIAVGCPVIVKPAAPRRCAASSSSSWLRQAGLPEAVVPELVTADNALCRAARDRSAHRFPELHRLGPRRLVPAQQARAGHALRARAWRGGAGDRRPQRSTSTRSSSRSSRAATITLARSASRRSASSCTRYHDAVRGAAGGAGAGASRGRSASAETEVGPLILPREVDARAQLDRRGDGAWARGSRSAARACPRPRLSPTILLEPAADAKVSREEIFGPVTCVYGFATSTRPSRSPTACPSPSRPASFHTEIGPALRAAERLDASAVMINDHTAFRADWMPFAGRSQSGYGIGGIRPTMDEMSEEKMLVFRHAD